MSRTKSAIRETKCKKCGKNFVIAVEHRYKDGSKYYCSWTCYNHRNDGNSYTDTKKFQNEVKSY